jgi:hypothetical protein
MEKMLQYGVLLLGCCVTGCVGVAIITDKGPAEITMQSSFDRASTPNPARFPHAAHQAHLHCGVCHHSGTSYGARVAYFDGQIIHKCEECHNSTHGMDEKVDSLQKVAHALCQDCHLKTKPELNKCSVCHPK